MGNTLSTGDGKTGSYSQSKVHENRQKELQVFDAKLICKTITDYLNRLEQMNYGSPKGVVFTFEQKKKKDLKELSEVVKNLSSAGYAVEEEEIERQFGFKVTLKNSEVQTHSRKSHRLTQSNHSQQSSQPLYEDELGSQVPGTKEEQALIENIYTLLMNAKSFDEVYQLLLDQYTEMDLTTLEASLFKAMANSQILGDAEVQQEEDTANA